MEFIDIPAGPAIDVDGSEIAVADFCCGVQCVSVAEFESFVSKVGYKTQAEIEGAGSFRECYLTKASLKDRSAAQIPAPLMSPKDAFAFASYSGYDLVEREQWLRLAFLGRRKIAEITGAEFWLQNSEITTNPKRNQYFVMNGPIRGNYDSEEADEYCTEIGVTFFEMPQCFRLVRAS